MASGKGSVHASNANWRNLDRTLQEMSTQPLQEAAQSMSLGNWATNLLTSGDVSSQSMPHGQDAWSGYWWADPTQGASMPASTQTQAYTDPQTGAMQYTPSGVWASEAGPVLGSAYEQDINQINEANKWGAIYQGRGSEDYNQIQQDRSFTESLQSLLNQDYSLFGSDIANINKARDVTYGLETGSGLFGSQKAYIDQAVSSGQASVQQKLASMGLGESTQNAMLQNQVKQAGAATAGQLVQGNIQLSEAQQNIEQQLYGADISRYSQDIERIKSAQNQQTLDEATYKLDTDLGLNYHTVSQNAVASLLGIQGSLLQTVQQANTGASQFFNNALAPYGYILSDLATRSGINVANAQTSEKAMSDELQGIGSILKGLGSIVGGFTGGGGKGGG